MRKILHCRGLLLLRRTFEKGCVHHKHDPALHSTAQHNGLIKDRLCLLFDSYDRST